MLKWLLWSGTSRINFVWKSVQYFPMDLGCRINEHIYGFRIGFGLQVGISALKRIGCDQTSRLGEIRNVLIDRLTLTQQFHEVVSLPKRGVVPDQKSLQCLLNGLLSVVRGDIIQPR